MPIAAAMSGPAIAFMPRYRSWPNSLIILFEGAVSCPSLMCSILGNEAAMSLGMTTTQTLMYVVFPQAIKNSFPSIGNQLIVNIKDSSMLNVITVTELYFQTTSVAGSNYRYIETFMVSAVLYLILTTLASFLLNYLEKRMDSESSMKDFCS